MAPEPERRSAGSLQTQRKRQRWPPDREFRILSIDGGGIRGILPAAVLAGLEERYLGNASVADCFDLMVGTSTGGILALGLGAGLTGTELLELYVRRGKEVFPHLRWPERCLNSPSYVVLNRCDHRALERLITEALSDRALWQSTKRLCIPSVDARFGDVFVFKTPHHPDFRKDWQEPMAKVAMATSAAPSFFRPLDDGTYTYLDGGIWANNPTMIGIVEALSAFEVSPERIKVLSLGCVETSYGLSWYHRYLGGWLLWAPNIIGGSLHFQSLNAVGQAGLLIGRDRLLRINYPPITPRLELNDWANCAALLPTKAGELLNEFGQRIADQFLFGKADVYVPIYTPERRPV